MMKKILLCLLLSLGLMGIKLQAQDFGGGLMAGLVGSQVFGDPSSGYNKLGSYVGIFANRQFTVKSAAELQMYYIQKGARENPTDENGNFQYLLRINMIEIPVLYKYTINQKLLLSGGLAYSYIIGTPYEEANYSSSLSSATWNQHGASFLLGIEYRLTERLTAIFKTNNSITPIREHVSGEKRLFNRGQYSDALQIGLSINLFQQQIK